MATTVCATEGGVHTLRFRAHIFLTVSLRDVQTSRRRMAQGVCSAPCHISPSHPLHSHFIRRPRCSRTVTSRPHSRLNKPLFRKFLMVVLLFREEAKKACLGKPLQDRERRKIRFCDQRWRVDVKERKVDGTVFGVILFRLTVNSVLMNEILENTLNEELNKLFLVNIQLRENKTSQSTTWRPNIWSEEIQNMH